MSRLIIGDFIRDLQQERSCGAWDDETRVDFSRLLSFFAPKKQQKDSCLGKSMNEWFDYRRRIWFK